MNPPLFTSLSHPYFDTGKMGASPKSPPKTAMSPGLFPGTGMILTPVVLLLTIPRVQASAIKPVRDV